MTKYVALLAVSSNFENEDYGKTVLGDVDDFVMNYKILRIMNFRKQDN